MKIEFDAPDLELSPREIEQVERRVLLALARFGDRIGRVAVHWTGSTFEEGAELTLVTEVRNVGRLQASASSVGVAAAVAVAADRLQRAVARRLDNLNPQSRPIPRH
jgi:ribosome-associated translation inhibitor RaiA